MAKVNKNKEGMIMKRVVITGMGIISPLGNDVNSFWNQLIKDNREYLSLILLIQLIIKQNSWNRS